MTRVAPGDPVAVRHAPAIESMSSVRRRIYGSRLDKSAIQGIIQDVAAGRYTPIHLAAFLTATSVLPLDDAEVVALTRAIHACHVYALPPDRPQSAGSAKPKTDPERSPLDAMLERLGVPASTLTLPGTPPSRSTLRPLLLLTKALAEIGEAPQAAEYSTWEHLRL